MSFAARGALNLEHVPKRIFLAVLRTQVRDTSCVSNNATQTINQATYPESSALSRRVNILRDYRGTKDKVKIFYFRDFSLHEIDLFDGSSSAASAVVGLDEVPCTFLSRDVNSMNSRHFEAFLGASNLELRKK